MRKCKIGVLASHSENYFAKELQLYEKAQTLLLENFADAEFIFKAMCNHEDDFRKEYEEVRKEELDFLLVLISDFSGGDFMMVLQDCTIPIGVWTLPEPTSEGDIQLNGMVSMNLFTSIAQRTFPMKKQVKWFYGWPSEERFKKRLKISIQATRAKRIVAQTTIGIVGSVAPSFYNLEVDTKVWEEKYGVHFHHISIDELKKEMNNIAQQDITRVMETIAESATLQAVSESSLYMGSHVYLGLRSLCQKYHITALAAACWPDFQEEFKIVPCVSFTMLGHLDHIPVACEGDILGALSNCIAYLISSSMPTLMDVCMMNQEEEELLLWHCGIGSHDIAGTKRCIVNHPMLDRKNPGRALMGMAYNYTFKAQPLTVLRFSGNGKLACFEANVQDRQDGFTGTRGFLHEFKSDHDSIQVLDIVDTLMSEGVEHHLSIVSGFWEDSLREFASLTNTEIITILPYRDYRR